MDLPTISYPILEVKLPSDGRIVKIRPFLVKEEKLLLMAAQGKDVNDIINTTLQVIQNCILDGTNVSEDLPFFDIDYLFIAMRAKSIGETIEMNFTCRNSPEGKECGTVFPVGLDITKIVVPNLGRNPLIPLTKDLTIKMKYPSYAAMKTISSENGLDSKLRIIYNSIDSIITPQTVLTAKDLTRDKMIQFVDGLTQEYLRKLETWVDNFPTFHIEQHEECPSCKFKHKIVYKDFTSFF